MKRSSSILVILLALALGIALGAVTSVHAAAMAPAHASAAGQPPTPPAVADFLASLESGTPQPRAGTCVQGAPCGPSAGCGGAREGGNCDKTTHTCVCMF